MGVPTREEIYQALFALVTPLGPAPGGNGTFASVSREVQQVQRVDASLQPVLMQYEMDESWDWQAPPLAKKALDCWFLIGVQTNKGTPGATLLNPLIDAVENVLRAPLGQPFQTLSGYAFSCQPLELIKDVGDNSTQNPRQASASLRVHIIVPAR